MRPLASPISPRGVFSESDEDPAWDKLLETLPGGQFQQSSAWARCKRGEGWRPLRAVYSSEGEIFGGFQVLLRRTRFGQIGMVAKGPVTRDESILPLKRLLAGIASLAKERRWAAVIVQPAEAQPIPSALFEAHGFDPNHLIHIYSRTQLIDLTPGLDQLVSNMRRRHTRDLRQARSRGVTLREGGADNAEEFFQLMASSCARQNTRPTPPSADGIRAIWEAFAPRGGVRLTFADYQGKAIVGGLVLYFGNRATFWKRGWSGEYSNLHGSTLLTYEAIEWAAEHGYEIFDFVSMERSLADALLAGEEPTEELKHSVSFFNLGFGGGPVMLPEARVRLANPVLRQAYRWSVRLPWMRKLARQVLGR